MINNKIDFSLISEKTKLLEEASVQLKKEFVGIDYQIDQVLDNLRTWFLFPELQERPMVISLFGMSGCGKTQLVKRISELLHIEEDYVYFNFAKIDEMTSWEIEENIEDEISNDKPNRMFIYDEFQYAATLDEHGAEKDKKSGLKTFWELLDTGIFHRRYSYRETQSLNRILKYLEIINRECPIVIKDGVWINQRECLKEYNEYDIRELGSYFNINLENNDEVSVPLNIKKQNGAETFLKESCYNTLYRFYIYKKGDITEIEFHDIVLKYDYSDWKNLIEDCIKYYSRGYDMDFKQSVIFVIANLDEAYKVSFDVNPDMSPDQFNSITKKLTIVDIKEALKRRFRNEQIARLGNSYVIYPSFSSESFRKIIDLYLKKYAENVLAETGYVIEYDDSINKIIYKEGVFPTHGTRPILSTIQEIVRSKLPFVVEKLYKDDIDVDSIKYSFNRGYFYATAIKDGNQVTKYKFKEKLKVENLRESKNDDRQALVAVHESGHFVMYAKLYGKMPKMVCSVTANSDSEGFLLDDDEDNNRPKSAQEFLKDIQVALGGYVAEETIFGVEHITCGSSSDLRRATSLASMYVREYCLGNFKYVSTYLTHPDISNNGRIIKEDDNKEINEEIKKILNKCLSEVRATFAIYEWRKMLKGSAKYLATNSSLPKQKMLELYNAISEKLRNNGNNPNYYKDIVDKF